MKRCSDCRRDYFDDSLRYCLDDGAVLLDGPAQHSELPTVMMSETGTDNDAPTLCDTFAGESVGTAGAVAVLPFANLSRNEDGEYFSDGLAEELLSVLSRIKKDCG